MLAGCGQTYRPVVSAINPVGPAAQPTKYAVAISNTGTTTPGLATYVDFSGDTILSTPSVLTNPDPSKPLLFGFDSTGSTAFLANSAGTLDVFPLSNPESVRTQNVLSTTLPLGGNAAAINVIPTSQGSNGQLFLPEPGRSAVAILSLTGVISQEVAVAPNPVWVLGSLSTIGPRVYALSQGNGTGNGVASAIETSTALAAVSAVIPTGVQPVFGVETADASRAFILNKGSGTVTVIDAQQNMLDSTTPLIPATGTLGTAPVWAVLVPVLNELLVLNQGNGTTPGTVSVISIPTCNVVTQPNNPLCNSVNIQDAASFGTVQATIPVGINPTMISVLADASKAYVVNSGNAAAGVNGGVSVINLSSNVVTATIPATTGTSATSILGHPDTLALSYSTPTGKVYVTATDSNQMTVISTDQDDVTAHIALQGLGVRVLTTAP